MAEGVELMAVGTRLYVPEVGMAESRRKQEIESGNKRELGL